MNATDNDKVRAAARDAQQGWLSMTPADFDSQLPMVQGSLFSSPDPMGTPAMFGGTFGEDL